MKLSHQRIFFSLPPQEPSLSYRGRIYDLEPGTDETQTVRRLLAEPQQLNFREADLAAVSYDPAQGSWRLLRDFGQTPLYYIVLADGFAWSFHYAELLKLVGPLEADEATMFDYLATHYRYIFRDPGRCFHKGLRQVPAGGWVDISPQGYSQGRWLNLSPPEDEKVWGPDEASEELMGLLRRSVHLRRRAFDRPAFTVSSGLDSGTVASLAAAEGGEMNVFSVGYSGQGVEQYDETAGIAQLLEGRDWNWKHLNLQSPDLVQQTSALVALSGSPVVTVTWLAYYLLAKELEGFEYIFTGIGGDECLAGEFLHFFYFFADLKKSGQLELLEQEAAAWSRLHDHPVFKKNRAVLEDFWLRNIDFASGETRVDQKIYRVNWRFFEPQWLELYSSEQPPLPRPYPDFLPNRLFQELSFETTPPTLWGLFMANEILGLTAVSPFLSPNIFRFALPLPGQLKYDQGLTKALLRRGLVGVVPEKVRLNSLKTGFNAPIDRWFAEPKVYEPCLELLHYGPLAKRGWLKKGAADEIVSEHLSGRANHMMLLWTLLNASVFLN